MPPRGEREFNQFLATREAVRDVMRRHTQTATDLESLFWSTLRGLREIKGPSDHYQEPYLAYVAGVLTSEGDFEQNRERLRRLTEKARFHFYPYPVFSAVDVFSDGVYERLKESKEPYEEREIKFRNFWKNILSVPGLVTHVYMTPRWNISKGAIAEEIQALRNGLNVCFVSWPEESATDEALYKEAMFPLRPDPRPVVEQAMDDTMGIGERLHLIDQRLEEITCLAIAGCLEPNDQEYEDLVAAKRRLMEKHGIKPMGMFDDEYEIPT